MTLLEADKLDFIAALYNFISLEISPFSSPGNSNGLWLNRGEIQKNRDFCCFFLILWDELNFSSLCLHLLPFQFVFIYIFQCEFLHFSLQFPIASRSLIICIPLALQFILICLHFTLICFHCILICLHFSLISLYFTSAFRVLSRIVNTLIWL